MRATRFGQSVYTILVSVSYNRSNHTHRKSCYNRRHSRGQSSIRACRPIRMFSPSFGGRRRVSAIKKTSIKAHDFYRNDPLRCCVHHGRSRRPFNDLSDRLRRSPFLSSPAELAVIDLVAPHDPAADQHPPGDGHSRLLLIAPIHQTVV